MPNNEYAICGRCLEDTIHLYVPRCQERPELLIGCPLGMYHCPDCGTMVVAGLSHPLVCERCGNGLHVGWVDYSGWESCLRTTTVGVQSDGFVTGELVSHRKSLALLRTTFLAWQNSRILMLAPGGG